MNLTKTPRRPANALPLNSVFGPTFQGEGPHAGRVATFARLGGCNLACNWCIVPGMLVLLPDFTWAPVESLRVGDAVLGRTNPDKGKHGVLAKSTVTATTRRQAPLVRVNGNLTCSEDTRVWVSRNKNARSGWREFTRSEGLNCTFLAEPTKRNQADYERGYVAGMADGDGCFWTLRVKGKRSTPRRFRLALNNQDMLDRTRTYAERAGFELRPGNHVRTGFKGKGDMACLWLTRDSETRRFEQWVEEDVDSESWSWGYLAGAFDSEGNLSSGHILRLSQYTTSEDGRRVYERMANAAQRCHFSIAREEKGVRIHGRGGELWRFMSGATPVKAPSLVDTFSRAPNNARQVQKVEDAGTGEVVSLTTTTGNYIAEGWLVHNCDSADTWDRTRYDLEAANPWTPVETITDRVRAAGPDHAIVVVTGGEPLIHQRRAAFTDLLETLTGQLGRAVHVETNGTITPTPAVARQVAHFTVSPKLANGGDPVKRRITPTALRAFAQLATLGRACFKFVTTDPDDLAEVDDFTAAYTIPPEAVWIMPEGATATTVLTTHRPLAEAVLARGYNTTTRLHTLLWNNESNR